MFDWEGGLPEPSVRMADDMRTVLKEPECPVHGPLYFMYREVARNPEDRAWLASRNLRYDLTVIPPAVLCGEKVKTKGHYHPANPSGVGYPEVYEVLEGSAHYLLQNRDLSDVVLIEAGAGARVIIPPSYGHVTINPQNSTLIMANIVSTEFSSDYGEYEKKQGAAYYELSDGSFIRNPRYSQIPPLRRLDGKRMGMRCPLCPVPLYSMVGSYGEGLLFLNKPEKYLTELALALAG